MVARAREVDLLTYLRTYEPQELVQMVTGERINPRPYLRYLCAKYGEVYGLG